MIDFSNILNSSTKITFEKVKNLHSKKPKRFCFNSTHKRSLREVSFEGSSVKWALFIPFQNSIKKIFEKETGLRIYETKKGTFWCPIENEADFQKALTFKNKQNLTVFLRDNLDLSIAISEHYLDSETRTGTVTRTANTSVWEYSVKDGDVEKYSGTVTLPQELPSDISPINFTTLTASYDGTVPMRELGEATDTGEQRFVTNMTLTKTTAGADFVLNNTTLTAGADSMGISNFSISTGYDYNDTTDKTTLNFVKFNSLTLNGTVSGYSMSGTVAVPTYVENNSLENENFFDDEEESFNNSKMIPKVVTFTGNITNTDTTASLTGTLSVDWLNAATMNLTDASNDEPSVDVSFNGTLQMPARPEMVVNLGYTNSNNHFTFSYSYDATVINGIADFDEEMQNGTIVLTNHLGLEATIKQLNGETVYGPQSSVKKGGKVIGELQRREDVPVIKYIDGTFESLP